MPSSEFILGVHTVCLDLNLGGMFKESVFNKVLSD